MSLAILHYILWICHPKALLAMSTTYFAPTLLLITNMAPPDLRLQVLFSIQDMLVVT